MQDNIPLAATPRRRGRRIKQTAWPGILKLYQDGATLTAIARIYDCTPSAICYIVKKAERVYGDLTQFSKGAPIDESYGWASTSRMAEMPAARPSDRLSPPFDEWAERMLRASKDCLRYYRQWKQTGSDVSHYDLADSVHEIRRALARLEIDMSEQSKTSVIQPDNQNI